MSNDHKSLLDVLEPLVGKEEPRFFVRANSLNKGPDGVEAWGLYLLNGEQKILTVIATCNGEDWARILACSLVMHIKQDLTERAISNAFAEALKPDKKKMN